MEQKMGVYTLALELLGILEKYNAILYEERAFTAGSFTLSCPMTEENRSLLQPDRIIWFQGSAAGVIECLEESAGEKGPEITVKGPMLTGLLARRILWGQFDLYGKPAALMSQLVSQCLIEPVGGPAEERKVPNLVLGSLPEETGPSIRKQKTGGTLLEALEELGEANQVAFGVALDASVPQMVFWVRPGVNRTPGQAQNDPVFFSTELDDVLSSEYSYNSGEYRNTALVAGQGEGANRVYVTVDENGEGTQEPAKYSPFIPAGETVALLTSQGQEMLVRVTGEGGYISAYTGQQIDQAVETVLSGGLEGKPGPGVPQGGAAGQVLAKKSAADYDTQWINLPEGGGTAGVTSFKGRTGAVVPQIGDYTAAMVGALSATTVIPSKTSDLTNDSAFVTESQVNAAIQKAILDSWEGSY